MADKITVSYLHGDSVSAEFMTSMTDLLRREPGPEREVGNLIRIRSSVNINNARNNVVRGFLNSEDDWLLMVDTDMVFKPTLLDDLFTGFTNVEEMPIIGSLAFSATREGMVLPHVYNWEPGGDIEVLREYDKGSMVRVGAIGAGCFVSHRSALLAILENNKDSYFPWFDQAVYNGVLLGEDFTFCQRARDAGLAIYVNTGVRVGHVKNMIISEPMYARQLDYNDLLTNRKLNG